ncbi:DUF6215 domain-containing protein [Streptomyces sp. NPDC048340]|uniref:DUF6215 domain-containing protein n=1 Tax=Streptomyces sp. NPDC048340 TaxID=3365537 RepID=UPI00371FDA1E
MSYDYDTDSQGPGAWAQAITAVVLVGALAAGFWTIAQHSASSGGGTPPPLRCSNAKPGKPGKEPAKEPGRASGLRLCETLNRPDLPALLGTPGEVAKAISNHDSDPPADGTEGATPSAKVTFDTYTVTLSADYNGSTVARTAALLEPAAQQTTLLDRPAVLYSERTLAISFRLDGSDSTSGPGAPARVLTVAQDPKDGGGTFSVVLWREDGRLPEDALLLHLAGQLLPTLLDSPAV